MTETYYIHDNYDKPFKVIIDSSTVNVYKNNIEMEPSIISDNVVYTTYTIDCCREEPILAFYPEKVFVGESTFNEMTEFSGCYGPGFTGNSILLHIGGLDYVHIGEEIYQFTALNTIEQFVSHVGSNDVPYPYAVDSDNRYYMLLKKEVANNIPEEYKNDPYKYHFHSHLITTDEGCVPPKKPMYKNFENIRKFYIGGEPYTLTYHSEPEKDYERIERWDDFGIGMEIVKTNGRRVALSKEDYVDLLNNFGELIGVSKIQNIRVLQERVW